MTRDTQVTLPDPEERVTLAQKQRALMYAQTALAAIGPGCSAQQANTLAERACTAVGRVWMQQLAPFEDYTSGKRRMMALCEQIIALPETP